VWLTTVCTHVGPDALLEGRRALRSVGLRLAEEHLPAGARALTICGHRGHHSAAARVSLPALWGRKLSELILVQMRCRKAVVRSATLGTGWLKNACLQPRKTLVLHTKRNTNNLETGQRPFKRSQAALKGLVGSTTVCPYFRLDALLKGCEAQLYA
jgi:hypothetical protein